LVTSTRVTTSKVRHLAPSDPVDARPMRGRPLIAATVPTAIPFRRNSRRFIRGLPFRLDRLYDSWAASFAGTSYSLDEKRQIRVADER
jgi:hypothetical protein